MDTDDAEGLRAAADAAQLDPDTVDRLIRQAGRFLRRRTPPDLGAASRDLRSTRPFATEVVFRADEQQSVRPPRGRVQRPTTVALSQPTDRFEIRYVLRGSVRHNKPSSAGRALGAVGPMTSQMPGDSPVAIAVLGEAVRNLGCVRLPVDQQACIAGERPNARVNRNLPFRAALVQVQLDLKAER